MNKDTVSFGLLYPEELANANRKYMTRLRGGEKAESEEDKK